MAFCWPSLILLVVLLFTTYASAANIILTDELTNFVPTCAQQCFISFLDINFQSSSCSNTPTLECLCSHNTTTGYTVGEGAVQCILGEVNTGFCSGNDASQTEILRAFQMCSGEANALPETHGTITATLIVESSMPSIVVVAPATETTMPPSITTMITMSTSRLSTMPSATSTSTPTGQTGPSNTTLPVTTSPPPTKLTQDQIIGMGAGVAGAGIIGLTAIMCVLFFQRRKTRKMLAERGSGGMPFQMDPEFYGVAGAVGGASFQDPMRMVGNGAGGKGKAKKLAKEAPPPVPPIPPRLEISNPNMFSRRSIMQETIGLAISPDQTTAPEKIARRSSRLLPEKPTLKLTMPPSRKKVEPQGLSFPQGLKPVSAISRQSTATQFELDEDSADTAVNSDNAWGRGSTERILLNTNKDWEADVSTIQEAPPAAIAVMRPDEFHWRPPSTSPTTKTASVSSLGRKIGSFSLPRRSQDPASSLQVSQPSILARAVSSVYSARGSVSGSEDGRKSATRPRNSYLQSGPYDQPAGPFKTPDLDADNYDGRFAELSPVVESPASGKSPVSYPKIPKRLSSAEMMLPPPPQPDFTKALGAAGMKPWRQAELVAQRDRERQVYENPQATPSEIQIGMLSPRQGLGHQQVTGRDHQSPPTRTFSFPAPPPQAETLPRQIPLALLAGRRPSPSPAPLRQPKSPPPPPLTERKPIAEISNYTTAPGLIPFTLSTSPRPPNLRPDPRALNTPARPGASSSSIINPLSAHPSITFTRSSSVMSQSSVLTATSGSSSLLAKRRGEKQARELMLANEEDQKRQQAKWRVLKREEIELAKTEGWRPRLGSPAGEELLRGAGAPAREGEIKESVREFAFERTELPRTPGWVPKLTPTRRGDDLFLNVQ